MKVALCLTGLSSGLNNKTPNGQVWNGKNGQRMPVDWKTGFEHYNRHILSKNDVDVFMHSWREDDGSEIVGAYNPVEFKFEPQITFGPPTSKKHITVSRWYSMNKCVELKKLHEINAGFKYDIVMVSRFDLAWNVDVILDRFDPSFFYVSNWCIARDKKSGKVIRHAEYFFDGWDKKMAAGQMFHEHTGWPHDKSYNALADYWFFSCSENMDRFASLYHSMDHYLKIGEPSNHEYAWKHLRRIGLLSKVKFAFHIHDECHLTRNVNHKWRRR